MNVQDVKNMFDRREKIEYVFFWRTNSYFSNWHPSDFIVDDIKYWCVEQYMMAKKAELFKDHTVYNMIMTSDSQRDIKALGRKIRNFDENIWVQHREQIVFDGNYAKFTQNPKLKNFIMKQKGKILVEASPYDRIWGIGMESMEEGIVNPYNWQGLNLLGFVLMDVRDRILLESGC